MDKVYIVMAQKHRDGFTQEWIVGVFYSEDRARETQHQLRSGNHCDESYVLEEDILDAKVGAA